MRGRSFGRMILCAGLPRKIASAVNEKVTRRASARLQNRYLGVSSP